MKEVTLDCVLSVVNKSEKIHIEKDKIDVNLQDLGMDSITFIQIIVCLEEEFGCEIPDSKLIVSEMDTIQKIVCVLQDVYNEQIE